MIDMIRLLPFVVKLGLCLFALLICITQEIYAAKSAQNTTGIEQQELPPSADQGVVDTALNKVTPDQSSILESRLKKESAIANNSLGIIFYQPNYVLPYYYTGSPYQAIYNGQTPDNQKVMSSEFKAQLSLMVPLWKDMFGNPDYSLNVGYTQLSYWQFYAKSQYFRETNYEPELFVTDHFHRNWQISYGVVHQSNGRGGSLERSWNRAYLNLEASGEHWLVSIKPWVLIFKPDSSDLHNPDIAHYLGHERIMFAYVFNNKMQASIALTNIESGMKRGAVELDYSFPLTKHINGFVQYFNGYGQSLIEYDHRTQSVGIGIALSHW
ncbi:phospholipase A [Piscirickettsia salmonis]|nr:phospholipase A [Piscirickettsia salmonis]AKP74683.2 phospholipase [Piscirickettsia salmonis LF-89 = ATCC VR-1361]ALY01632.1 phospholipase [Piscirickettsia salmonis]AMA41144.1 phospholipase [Piscirickettsia salmonis]AOS36333.1 phospholipase [Piscirickettsia salmonis]APS61025.1 phospholipase [Piscirickettsia salmonis]